MNFIYLVNMVDDYLIMSIALESNNVKEVIKEITNELNDLNVSINDFERKKKSNDKW